MNILVTGGTGFLGRHIVWRLAELGHKVLFTGRNPAAAAEVMGQLPAAHQVSWIRLEHGEAQSQLIIHTQGMDAVIHCAALSSPWGKRDDFIRANLTSTREVITACESQGVKRLVHISTPSLYFDFTDRFAVREDSPLPPPVNDYAATKAAAEQWVLGASAIPERVILRPRAIFGPWDNTLMPRLLRVMRERAIPLMRGGNAVLDITYVENLVDAILLALSKPLPPGTPIYNVTNGEPLPLPQLLQQMADAFGLPLRTRHLPWWVVSNLARVMEINARLTHGREPTITRYGAGVLAFSQTLDISAICRDLGYVPRISIAEGMRRHAAWLQTHPQAPL